MSEFPLNDSIAQQKLELEKKRAEHTRFILDNLADMPATCKILMAELEDIATDLNVLLAKSVVDEDNMEDQGLEGDERLTCHTHQCWITDGEDIVHQHYFGTLIPMPYNEIKAGESR